jgi:hypothetical protein
VAWLSDGAFGFRAPPGSGILWGEPIEGAWGMVSCSSCGATAEAPLGWMTEVTERGPRYLCDRCSRDNIRSIEGRLDPVYW